MSPRIKGLREFRENWASTFEGTCTWCRFYLPQFMHGDGNVGRCRIDGAETTNLSRCGAQQDRVLYAESLAHDCTTDELSAHEKAELLRVKLPTYEHGLHFYMYLSPKGAESSWAKSPSWAKKATRG